MFRFTAAAQLRFQKRRSTELGPDFDCVHCRRPEYDERKHPYCPRCPLTIARETAVDETVEEVEAVLKTDADEDEIRHAVGIYETVAQRLSLNDGRIDPNWSMEESLLALSVVAEEGRARMIDAYETSQKAKKS